MTFFLIRFHCSADRISAVKITASASNYKCNEILSGQKKILKGLGVFLLLEGWGGGGGKLRTLAEDQEKFQDQMFTQPWILLGNFGPIVLFQPNLTHRAIVDIQEGTQCKTHSPILSARALGYYAPCKGGIPEVRYPPGKSPLPQLNGSTQTPAST